MVYQLRPKVYAIPTNDWDRRLFDELIPLPEGTSYNAYLIRDEKTALIDTVDPRKEEEFLNTLKNLGLERIDYLISHHAEQDHSGLIPKVLSLYPEAKVVCSEKCQEFLIDLLLVSKERFLVVKDGERISLGEKTLEFISTPWVHWPETIVSYLIEDKILFSCDLFGSHLATTDLFAREGVKLAAKRYYAEIMMPFRTIIKKHLERLAQYPISLICPSHGPIYDKPEFILELYKDWVGDAVKNEVVLIYVSMHHSTRRMVEFFIEELAKQEIQVKPFNLTVTDIGELAMALVDCATIVIASPTVLTGPHPAIVYAVYLANALRPKARFASVIGSYGWGGRMLEYIKNMLSNLSLEILEPVVAKGYPKEKEFSDLKRLADSIYKKHKEIGILKKEQ
uniref:FprA family A-type flavoprotein n=1 Tax=candidate division WOR-3 bacterium TaxID=2052148 RepID=A0A7C3YQT9_UNCW3